MSFRAMHSCSLCVCRGRKEREGGREGGRGGREGREREDRVLSWNEK